MRFIHLSDLHFNPGVDGRASRDLREGLISYLTNLNTRADDLIIPATLGMLNFKEKIKMKLMN